MKARTALLALSLTAMAPAYAGSPVADLADATGLTKRQVLMLISNRTPYAEYRTSYISSLAKFRQALGYERAEKLLAGETITLERRRDADVRVAALNEEPQVDQRP
jgi:hypothetical protein